MSFSGTITLRPAITLTRERGQTGKFQSWSPPFGLIPLSVSDGTGSGQAQKLYDGGLAGKITLGSSETLDLDLSGDATFKDAYEQAITFTKVMGLYLRSFPTNVHPIDFGPAASNGFLGPFKNAGVQMTLEPGQPWCTAHAGAGWAVTATTADLFRLVNTGATAGQVVELMIWGW